MPAAAATAPHTSPLTTKWKESQSVVTPGWTGVGVLTIAGEDVVDDGNDVVVDEVEELLDGSWVVEKVVFVVVVGLAVAVESVVAVLVVAGEHVFERLQHTSEVVSYSNRISLTAW